MTDPTDLSSLDTLRRTCEDIIRSRAQDGIYPQREEKLVEFINWFRTASPKDRASESFQQRLWNDNPVAAVGQGDIPVDGLISDAAFRSWFAGELEKPLPDEEVARIARLEELREELALRAKEVCRAVPRLKINRILATIAPDEMTTVVNGRQVRKLLRALLGKERESPVGRQVRIRRRLDEALGESPTRLQSSVARMTLAWPLYGLLVRQDGEDATTRVDTETGAELLKPLSAARRRRSLTSIGGGLASVLSVLEFIGDGVTREELLDHLRAQNPNHKDNSLSVQINTFRSELNVIQGDGHKYVLTNRGEALLESEDAGELADWLLTRILGVDLAVATVRDAGAVHSQELVEIVRSANPGWTTTFVPGGIIGWLRSFGVLETDNAGIVTLTEEGQRWGSLITWEPERLPPDSLPMVVKPDPAALQSSQGAEVKLPPFDGIYKKISAAGEFPSQLVAELHAGLWANKRRHFAILTGLSGAGKTLLACSYAGALSDGDANRPEGLCIVAVQPGWYDPGSLLGYVNPLRGDSFVRTAALDFILQASGDPTRPYVLLLDEMNLSHPEQYLASLLSAMETGGNIDLHREGASFDGVPGAVAYPSNLAIIGTVNMDETTHGLSDKVLDRAHIIEFWTVNLDAYPRWGKRSIDPELETKARALLGELMAHLQPVRLHFGWRVVDDVLSFLERAGNGDGGLDGNQALDRVVYAKLIPKLRGEDAPRFRKALAECARVLSEHGLERSLAKVGELQEDLSATGTARFWR